MISQRIRGVEALYTALQAAAVILLYWFWYFLTPSFSPSFHDLDATKYETYCMALVIGLVAGHLLGRRTTIRETLYERSVLAHVPVALNQAIWSVGSLLLLLVATKDWYISRAFLFSMLPALFVVLLWTNAVTPSLLLRLLFRESRQENTLLIGSCLRANQLAHWFERKMRFGFRAVGVLCDESHEHFHGGAFPLLGAPEEVERIVAEQRITQVVLLEFPRFSDFANIVGPVQRSGARLLIVSNLAERLGHAITMFEDDGLQFFALHEEPLENPVNRLLKRALDIVIATAVIVFLLPVLCVIVWLLQRLQSPGPLFYRQVRAGLQNRQFIIWKFRTMQPGPENDPDPARIFPAARLLRRCSIDEFPQFINVLRGEMSIVGPRPHLVEHNRQFAEVMAQYHIRAFVKPGITGLAQVRGFRGEVNTTEAVAHRLESDMLYLEKWSILLDLAIILRTGAQLFFPPQTAR